MFTLFQFTYKSNIVNLYIDTNYIDIVMKKKEETKGFVRGMTLADYMRIAT